MDNLIDIINTSFFEGLATIITGLLAYLVYTKQKRDTKIQAARVLITEIRIVEDRVDQIKAKLNDSISYDLPPIFPSKSWKRYAHLFISDFDQDELKLLNSFYDYAELAEEFIKKDNEFFWVTTEERARVTVQKMADFSCEAINTKLNISDMDILVQTKRIALNNLLDKHNAGYSPTKSIDAVKKLIPNIPKITITSCGIKLKKLAKLNIKV